MGYPHSGDWGLLALTEPRASKQRKRARYAELTAPGVIFSVLHNFAARNPDARELVLTPQRLADLAARPIESDSDRCLFLQILRVAVEEPNCVQGWRIARDDRASSFRVRCARVEAPHATPAASRHSTS